MSGYYDLDEHLRYAICNCEVVRFTYHKSPTAPGEVRTFSPYQIEGHLVIGWDHQREGLRQFELSKISGDVRTADDEEYIHPHNGR